MKKEFFLRNIQKNETISVPFFSYACSSSARSMSN
jgi:hypothetical protein